MARLALVAALVVLGCGEPFPRDPAGTTRHVESTHRLRVGVTENPPFVVRGRDGAPSGVEVALAVSLARAHGAQVEWRWGQLEVLFAALAARELDLVIGGVRKQTPWEDMLGLTEPWTLADDGAEIVLAVPPGENRWLGEVERHALTQVRR